MWVFNLAILFICELVEIQINMIFFNDRRFKKCNIVYDVIWFRMLKEDICCKSEILNMEFEVNIADFMECLLNDIYK